MKFRLGMVLVLCIIILYSIMQEVDRELEQTIEKLRQRPSKTNEQLIENIVERKLVERELQKTRVSKIHKIAITAFVTAFSVSYLNGNEFASSLRTSAGSFVVAGIIGILDTLIQLANV
jgi:hypothetical protein